MRKTKAIKKQAIQEPYVPKLERYDTHIYVYILKNPRLLTPVPYKYKPNYQYILPLIKKINNGINIKDARC